MKSDSLIIIPTYNEKENISNIIHVVTNMPEHQFDVLVIDDNSPDGTAAIVEGIIAEMPGRVHLVKRAGKLGLGTAYIAGFKWALEHDYQYIIEMDADFSHRPEDLIPLQRACAEEGADVAVGDTSPFAGVSPYCVLYVPKGRAADYRMAKGWAGQFRAVDDMNDSSHSANCDVNGDGVVDIADATAVVECILGK